MPKRKSHQKPSKSAFLQPKQVKCFQCQTNFFIKFVIPRQAYSQKNNLAHWTERPTDQKQEWCNKCLVKLYYNKPLYWSLVPNLKRRQQLRKYLYDGKFSKQQKPCATGLLLSILLS